MTTALAVHLLLRRPARRIYQDYAVLALNLALWFLADALHVLFGMTSAVLNTLRLIIATGIPVTHTRFMRTFLEDESATGRRLERGLVIVAILLGVAIILRPIGVSVPDFVSTPAMILYIFGGVGLSLRLIAQRLQVTQSPTEQGRLRSLLVAAGIAACLTLLDYLPGVGYFFFGNIFVTLFLYFLFQIITKLRLLDLYEFLGRSVVTLAFALVIAAIFLFLTAFWRDRADLFVFNALIASLVVIILFEPLRNSVQQWIGDFLFAERFAFAARLERLQGTLAKTVEAQLVAQQIVEALDQSRRVTDASVYLLTGSGRRYELAAYVGAMPRRTLDVATDRPLLEILGQDHLVTVEGLDDQVKPLLYLDTPDSHAAQERISQVRSIMDELHAGVVVPFLSEEQVVGLLAVNDDRLREPYSTDEIALLYKVATQAAVALENSRVYERLRERDRLAALGEMSAGLAHEIRNPLGAIKGAAQLMSDADADPSSQGELASVVTDEVDRLNTVVTQFLHFAKPYQGNLEEVDLNEIVRRTMQLLEATKKREVEVKLDLEANLPDVRTDPEMVRMILMNLALNAFEAMRGEGTLVVRTFSEAPGERLLHGERALLVAVQFQDSGPGIKRDDLKRIFIPFFTTKARGTGLGLSICQRVVRSLGGYIDVHSETGRGATFSVHLPVTGMATAELRLTGRG